MKRIPLFALLASLCALLFCSACGERPVVTSPDGRITLCVAADADGPTWSVEVDGEPLLLPSRLGVRTRETLIAGTQIASVRHSSFDEEWTQPWGENKLVRNHYNEMAVTLRGAGDVALTLRARAFDDGVAFRYEWSVAGCDTLAVTDELTEFRFADEPGTLSWSIPGNFETYELQYREQPVAEVADANTPFTFRTAAGLYGSVHEAALYDYPEMVLRRDSAGVLKADLAPLPDGVKAYVPATFTTPWRTVQIGRRAVDLINSALILNLNEPSKIADTSWITPQKYVGVWWGMHLGTQVWTMGPRHGATTANALRHIDFAAENNIQGVLFEGWNKGWENWGGNQHFDYVEPYADFDLERIAAYARERGVELWMHAETGGNIPEFERQMEAAMQRYAELGIRTLKTGYAGGFKGGYLHHSQYGVQHYQRVVETAARYGIMIDNHEPVMPTGLERTWPNLMTQEAVRGQEYNAWSPDGGNPPEHTTVLPFLRGLAGPMDYTFGTFDFSNPASPFARVQSTVVRELAQYVVLYSPLQMASDLPENYRGHKAFDFIREVPTDWEQTLVPQAVIGDYALFVRQARGSQEWYLGAVTDEQARETDLALDFLTPGTRYTVQIYADAPDADWKSNPCAMRYEERTVTAADTLHIRMAPGGGCAVRFAVAK